MMMVQPHFVLLAIPFPGHVNPALHLAERLIRIGAKVTFLITKSGRRLVAKSPSTPPGLSFSEFSDGFDEGFKAGCEPENYMSEVKLRGTKALNDLVVSSTKEGCPITAIVYSLFCSWVVEVARANRLPLALLWNQPAAVFSIYYHYFHGYGDAIRRSCHDPSHLIKLPGLPPVTSLDLPSFIVPSTLNPRAVAMFEEHMKVLSEEDRPMVLVNTFEPLETEALNSITKLNLMGIGPLIPPSAFFDGDQHLAPHSNSSNHMEMKWLNSKPQRSVIYVSFGSICAPSKLQEEEIAKGLLQTGHPFLWVVRQEKDGREEEANKFFNHMEKLEAQGMIVPWCFQLEVLSHPAVGCFVTHCGWNSTLESLVMGVPMVAFPQWSDQGTSAKLIKDSAKVGVRLAVNEEGIVESEEIKKCLDLVMGEEGDEIRMNAKKWKDLAREAMREGGSSDKNLKAFVQAILENVIASTKFDGTLPTLPLNPTQPC